MPQNAPPSIGSTRFYFLPGTDNYSHAFEPGNYYVCIGMHSLKIGLDGGFWDRVQSVAVSTSVATSNPNLSARSMNTVVNREYSSQKIMMPAVSAFILAPVPATMRSIKWTVEFTIRRDKPVEDKLLDLLRSDAFTTALAFAPAALQAVSTVTGVVPLLLDVFRLNVPDTGQFCTGQHEILVISTVLAPGKYVAFDARSARSAEEISVLHSARQITIEPGNVLIDGNPVQYASYVVLELVRTPFIGLGDSDMEWVKLYRETVPILRRIIQKSVAGDKARSALAAAEESYITITTLQAMDQSFTDFEKNTWSTRLYDLIRKAREIAGAGGDGLHPAVSKRVSDGNGMPNDKFRELLVASKNSLSAFSNGASVLMTEPEKIVSAKC